MRMTRSNIAFALSVVTSVAVGTAFAAITYSIARSVLLEPVPLPQASDLVSIASTSVRDDPDAPIFLSSYPAFAVIAEMSDSSSGIVALEAPGLASSYSMRTAEGSVPVSASAVSAGYFETLEPALIAGRAFTQEEFRAEAPVVVLSERFALELHGSIGEALGAAVTLGDRTYDIVGVIPDNQLFPQASRLILPMNVTARAGRATVENDHLGGLEIYLRLRPGSSLSALSRELDAAADRMRELYPDGPTGNLHFRGMPLAEYLTSGLSQGMSLVVLAVMLLVVITFVNIGTLFAVRVTAARHTYLVRAALGASPVAILKTMVKEISTLAVLGTALGVVIAYAGLPFLLANNPIPLPNATNISVDWGVLAVVAAVNIVFTIAIAVVAARNASSAKVQEVLRFGSRVSFSSRRLQLNLGALAVVQIGVAVFLLAGTSLLVASFAKITDVEKGFDEESILTLRVGLPATQSGTHSSRVDFLDRMQADLTGLPGISSVGIATDTPVGYGARGFRFSVEGQPTDNPDDFHTGIYRLVTPGYLETLGTRLVEGRLPDARDSAESTQVAVVSRRMAETFWPERSALGMRIKRGGYRSGNPWRTVVGVVDDVRDQWGGSGPSIRAPIGLSLYIPVSQYENDRAFTVSVVAKVDGEPMGIAPVIRSRIAAMDPGATISGVLPLGRLVQNSLALERFTMSIFLVFAAAALFLCAFGTYTVIAFMAAQRRNETGVRLAMGATRSRIVMDFLRRGIVLAAIGAAAGLALIVFGLAHIRDLLFETRIGDPTLLMACVLLIVAIVLVSSFMPAVGAARTDPVNLLRND